MDIRGFLPVSLIEYPGQISSVVFTGGCNLRCPFCHNRDLVIGLDGMDKISEEDLLNKIEKKKEWIDAVCFTGGEPTLNADLPFLFEKIKQIKGISSEPLLIMLETNGTNPEMISDLIEKNLVDYVAMDIKAPFEDYRKLGASLEMIEKIKKTVQLIFPSVEGRRGGFPSAEERRNNSPLVDPPASIRGEAFRAGGCPPGADGVVSSEFRITAAPEIVTLENIRKIGEQIKGAKKAVLQQFRPNVTLDEDWQKKQPHSEEVLKEMADILREFAEEVVV